MRFNIPANEYSITFFEKALVTPERTLCVVEDEIAALWTLPTLPERRFVDHPELMIARGVASELITKKLGLAAQQESQNIQMTNLRNALGGRGGEMDSILVGMAQSAVLHKITSIAIANHTAIFDSEHPFTESGTLKTTPIFVGSLDSVMQDLTNAPSITHLHGIVIANPSQVNFLIGPTLTESSLPQHTMRMQVSV